MKANTWLRPLSLLAVLAAIGIPFAITFSPLSDTDKATLGQVLPAWLQGIGSVLAILWSIQIANGQHDRAEQQRREALLAELKVRADIYDLGAGAIASFKRRQLDEVFARDSDPIAAHVERLRLSKRKNQDLVRYRLRASACLSELSHTRLSELSSPIEVDHALAAREALSEAVAVMSAVLDGEEDLSALATQEYFDSWADELYRYAEQLLAFGEANFLTSAA